MLPSVQYYSHLKHFSTTGSNLTHASSLPSFLSLKQFRNRNNETVLVHAVDFHDDPIEFGALDAVSDKEFATSFVAWQMLSSSGGEETDDELGISSHSDHDSISPSDTSLTSMRRRSRTIGAGIWIKLGLLVFVSTLLLFVDSCAWKVVRLPLDTFHLSRPFFLSTALVWFTGHFIPSSKKQRAVKNAERQGWLSASKEAANATSGSIIVVLIGLGVAWFTSSSAPEVLGSILVTMSFVCIGALADALNNCLNPSSHLCTWTKLTLQVVIGTLFSLWLDGARISSPYNMRMLIPLPSPFGLVYLGKFYTLLSTLCFVSMANGLHLTDALDGLNGGTLVSTFLGMSIAVLPISSEISIFGASIAGSCLGFMLHNRYKTSCFAGETGAMALGGALAAMAACSGMFFPLIISSGIFILEGLWFIAQNLSWPAINWNTTNCLMQGVGHFSRMYGAQKPLIIVCKYCVSSVLALVAAYIGLASA